MNTQATPENCLLRDLSPAAKARVIESLYPIKTTYADEITNTMTCLRQVMTGLSELAELRQDYTDQIGGEIALALSGLIDQEIRKALVLLRSAVSECRENNQEQ